MIACLDPRAVRVGTLLLAGFVMTNAGAESLCRASIERRIAVDSRRAFDAVSVAFPRELSDQLRVRFGDAASRSFVFSNRGQRPAASRLLLVLPGSGFHPVYMLRNIERTVSEDTEVAVLEYPYLRPEFSVDAPFEDSGRIAADMSNDFATYRQDHAYDRVGIYASSLGGSFAAKLLQSGTRVDLLVLDGVQESRPLPWVCSSKGWLKDVLPPLLGKLPGVTLISNSNDRKERTKALRRLPRSASFTVVELEARHPWEEPSDIALRTPVLKQIFERSL